MDQLVITARSPFARRVRIALRRLDWVFEERMIDAFHPPEWLTEWNPLGLIPILRFTTGETWVDSQVILENMDELTRRVWPSGRDERILARKLSVWAQTVMQYSVGYYLEKQHSSPDPSFLDEYLQNIRTTLKSLSDSLANEASVQFMLVGDRFVSQPCVDWGIALEYLSLRVSEIDWRKDFPELEAIVGNAATLPVFQETRPPK